MSNLYKTLLDCSSEGIVIHENGFIIEANLAFANIFGFRNVESVIGKNFYTDYLTTESQNKILNNLSKKESSYEIEIKNMEGKTIFLSIKSQIVIHQGKELGVAFVKDVTGNKRVEKELLESKEKHKFEYDNYLYPLMTWQKQGDKIILINANKEFLKTIELRDYLNKDIETLFSTKERGVVIEKIKYALAKQENIRFTATIPTLFFNGIRTFEASCIVIDEKTVTLAYRDITDEQRNIIKLKEQQRQYELIINNVPIVILKINSLGQVLYISDNVYSVLGFTPDQIYKVDVNFWKEVLKPNELERIEAGFQELFEKSKPMKFEYQIKTQKGDWIWVEVKSGPIIKEGDSLIVYGVYRDITDRKKLESKIKESEEKFFKAFMVSPMPLIILMLKNGEIIEVNHSFTKTFKYSFIEVVGKKKLMN